MIEKKEAMKLRETASIIIHNLISITLDFERKLIHVEIFGRVTELPIAELDLHKNSCRDLIAYIKEKLQ